MTTFEVDAVLIVEAETDSLAEDKVVELLEEVKQSTGEIDYTVTHIMDTTTYGR